MNKFNIISILFSFILITFGFYHLSAQNTEKNVGVINKLATIKDGEIEQNKESTSLAKLKRGSNIVWKNVKLDDKLYYNDILRLNKNIWVRLSFKSKTQKGNISLFANQDTTLSQTGRYKILKDENDPNRISIDLVEGFAVFNVVKKLISANTRGLKSSVKSGSTSRALYFVDTDGSGYIYLQQGNLSFPQNTETPELKVGEVAYFKDGEIDYISTPNIQMLNQFNEFIKYNNATVWKKPFWKNPLTWVGIAAAGVGTSLLIIQPWKKEEQTVSGNININWGGN